jgi:hypothetical protein
MLGVYAAMGWRYGTFVTGVVLSLAVAVRP